MKTAFIGHRRILAENLPQRLTEAIKAEIERGCFSLAMGTHGEFDRLSLDICRKLKSEYPELQIEVVLNSLHDVKNGDEMSSPYSDVTTVMYEIEEAYYKRRIT